MAMSPGSRRRDNRTSGDQPQDPAPLGAMQEPLGSMDRPIPRTSDDNDVNLGSNGTGRSTGNLGSTSTPSDRGRGFTTTFAIIAAVLVVAFLVALFLGADGTNQATAPTDTQAPVADSAPGSTDDTTGSTTPTQPQETAPAGGGTGTGTAPANP
jgi:hypothetical protein